MSFALLGEMMQRSEAALSQAQVFYNIGLEFHEEINYSAALKSFKKAFDTLKDGGLINNNFSKNVIAAISSVHDKIAALQDKPNQYLIDVVLKELSELPANNSQTIIETSRQLINIGLSFQKENQDSTALDYFSRALAIQHEIPGHDYISKLFQLVGASCDKLNQQVNELIQATQYQEALKITNQMLDVVKNHSDNKELIVKYAADKSNIEKLINPESIATASDSSSIDQSEYLLKLSVKAHYNQIENICKLLPYNSTDECIIQSLGVIQTPDSIY